MILSKLSDVSLTSSVAEWFHLDTLDPERFVTSYFVQPYVLRIVRAFITFYIAATFIFSLVYNCTLSDFGAYLTYFTNLTYIGLLGYFVSSLVHSYFYSVRGDVSSFRKFPLLMVMHYALYHVVIVINILVPVVYWALLSNSLLHDAPDPLRWFNTINVHLLTAVWMLVDVILTRQRCDWRMFLVTLAVVILYTFEAWIVHADRGYWTYSFFSWDNGPIAIAWYIGVAAFVVIVFAIQRHVIHPLRDLAAKSVKQPKQLEDSEPKNELDSSQPDMSEMA